ncbi:MAG: carbohydrate binding domain-containing protein [Candidatus Saccharibacteria bacterium]|nr:carbohydrate binding domain-containing protein [Candidatus Saccharibacteria bacterium]
MPKTIPSVGRYAFSRFCTIIRHIPLSFISVFIAVFMLLLPLLGTGLLVMPATSTVDAALSDTLNFQARLYNNSGNVVSDGSYSIAFNLYEDATTGTSIWNETQSVTVRNGYFSTNLGSVTSFGSSIDWSEEKWLTMNVESDGEMTPRIKLTAVPYAFDSGRLEGRTADEFAQLAPSLIQAVNSANTALRINQTGAGNLLQLQGDGSNVLTLSKTGNLTVEGSGTFDGGLTVSAGGTFTNASSTLLTAISISDRATGGNIGSAATTVDVATTFNVNQTTASQSLTLPTPTDTTSGRIIYVNNVGSAEFTMYGNPVSVGSSSSFIWNGSSWSQTISFNTAGNVLQGGNTFGTDMVIGSNDTHPLNLITNGITRVEIASNGNVAFDTDTLFVDAVNNRVQVGSTANIDARLSVVGGADQTQLLVRAHSTQSMSNPLVLLQDSSGSELARINATTSSLFFGNGAGGSTASGANNTGIGASALGAVSTGTANTTLGSGALASVSVNSGNTAVGYNAGNLVTGSNNILFGYQAGDNITTGSNNIIIGYDLDASAVGVNNELNIGNVLRGDLSTGSALFQNTTDSTTGFQILDQDGGTPIFNVDTTNERIGIGTDSPGERLDVQGGDINTSGSLMTGGTTRITSTGVLQNVSHADAGNFFTAGTLTVERGGTGIATTTAYGLLTGGTTSTGAFQNAGTGTTGQVLQSNGASALPTWVDATQANSCTDCVALQGATPGTQQTGNINISGTIVAGSFSGDGSLLTDLNATNITTGTLADARLTSNVALLDRNNQTFTGNDQLFQNTTDSTTAFQIQDSAGTSNLFTADTTNSRIGIGTDSPEFSLHVVGEGSNYISNDAYGGIPLIQGRRAGGTIGSPTALQANDTFAQFSGRGYDGTGFSGTRAAMVLQATEAWSDTAQGSRIRFYTTASGTTSLATRMVIEQNGNVSIGGGYVTDAQLYVRSSGNTSATQSLRADNSDGDPLLFVRDDGRLGIGTSSPLQPFGGTGLHIRNDSGNAGLLLDSDATGAALLMLGREGSTNWHIENDSSDRFSLTQSGVAQRFLIDTSGNVAIGYSSPGTYKLAVNGNTYTGGNIVLAEGSGRAISVETRTTNTIGNDLTVSAGAAGSGGSAFGGGDLVLQGGNAAGTGNANGGDILLSGGDGVGTGAKGLVVISTPSFTTSATQNCASNCTITQANVDGTGVVVVDATASGLDVDLPDPTNTTAGRVVYVTAANGSNDFTLIVNGGGVGDEIGMRANTTATMIWNGSDWTAAGASSSTTLQAAYDNTLTSAGGAELVLNGVGGSADGLTIRNNPDNPIEGGVLEVQTSIGTNLFSVNNYGIELAANGGAETAGTFSTNWTAAPAGGTISRTTTTDEYVTGQAGVEVTTGASANHGVRNNLSGNPVVNTTYQVSFTARLDSGTFNTLEVLYSRDGGSNTVACDTYSTQTIVTSDWTKVTCTITTDGTTATNPDLIIRQTDATARTFWIDNLSFQRNDSTTTPSHVQIGGGITGGSVTLFTLDRSSTPPVDDGNDTYLGSMYYDTTTGRIQCYEADGWGACGSPPDNYVNLLPEFPGAVLNGTGVGTMTADFCGNGGGLSVNTTMCDSGEARNFYQWTSPQITEQEYSIYITYQLPTAFKQFASNDTITLTARTDNVSNGKVTYEMFRNEGGTINQCGTETTVTTTANTWQTVGISGNEADGCGFSTSSANNFVIFKINVKAQSNANVFVGELNFTTNGQ